jgi:hypothetical protein
MSLVLDRMDGMFLFLRAIHGTAWVRRASVATGICETRIRHYWQGRAMPTLLRLAAFKAYAVEEGVVATNPALRVAMRRRRKSNPQVSENRKIYFINQTCKVGPSTVRLIHRLRGSTAEK